jgi:hypothetical protein
MSSPSLPIKSPSGPSTVTPSPSSGADDVGAFLFELAASADSLAVDATRGGPPPEVLDQIAAAGAIVERLRASGHRLRFTAESPDGRTTIEIHDREGNAVRTLSTAEALEMAAGNPLE